MLRFFIIANSVWALGHLYVATRLVQPLSRRWLRILLYTLFAVLCLLGSGVFLADRLVPSLTLAYRWLAWTYIGSFSTLFALLLGRDLVLGVPTLIRRLRAPASELPSAERRRFLLNTTGGAAVGSTAVLGIIGLREARRVPEVVEVEVPIKGLPAAFDGYHIVQLSDVHVGQTIDKDFILPIVEQVTSLRPDLVVLTGDLVDGSVDELRDDFSPLAYLRAPDGVFCVTGNHEYYSGVDAWCAHFRELGMSVLNNQHSVIERQGARLVLAGVTDQREGHKFPGHTSDPKAAIAGAPADATRILLAHQPRSAFDASKLGYALQLSGHTHGGQFFPWNLFVGLVQPVVKGLAQIDGMWVYVNRGTCYWGPPLRSFVPPEITSLKLKRA
ncbi:MAG: metallophosphoesterase [Myxococcales bacterium]